MTRAGVAESDDARGNCGDRATGVLGRAAWSGVQAAKGLAWATGLPIGGGRSLGGAPARGVLANAPTAANPRPDRLGADPAPPPTPSSPSWPRADTPRFTASTAPSWAIRELGATRDDAAGEAFDKVAKVIGLGYPGGPIVDRLAARGDASRFPIPPPMARRDSLEFSFSGVKSYVARHVAERGKPATEAEQADVCAGFQRVVVESLVTKSVRAALTENVKTVVLAGGVAANRELRTTAAAACAKVGLTLAVPLNPKLHRQRRDDRLRRERAPRARRARRFLVHHRDAVGPPPGHPQRRRPARLGDPRFTVTRAPR